MIWIGVAFFTGSLAAALVYAEVDAYRRKNAATAQLIRLDEHRARVNAALAPREVVVPLRRRGESAIAYLFALPYSTASLNGTCRSEGGSTLTAGIGLAAVSEIEPFGAMSEQTASMTDASVSGGSKRDALIPRRLSLTASSSRDAVSDLLVTRDTAPLLSEQRGI